VSSIYLREANTIRKTKYCIYDVPSESAIIVIYIISLDDHYYTALAKVPDNTLLEGIEEVIGECRLFRWAESQGGQQIGETCQETTMEAFLETHSYTVQEHKAIQERPFSPYQRFIDIANSSDKEI